MKLMLDLDGVFANFVKAFNKTALDLFPGSLVSPDVVPQHWSFKDLLHEDQTDAVLLKCRNQSNFWTGLEPYYDSRAALQRLGSLTQHDIYFVTARFDTPGYSVSIQTRKWIWSRLGISPDFFSVIVVPDSAHSKRTVARAIRADFSIDDKPENVRKLSSIPGHYSWLLDRPYNQYAHDLDDFRVGSVEEFFQKIKL